MGNKERVKRHHKKLDEFKIRPYAEEGQTIRDYAKTAEMSVQKLFLQAVREYMARHSENENTPEVVESANGCMVEISREVYEKARLSANYHKCSVNEFVELAITEQRKREFREHMKNHKEETKMKTYKVKDEFIDSWFGNATTEEIEETQERGLTVEDIRKLSIGWGISVEDLMEEVEEA